MQKEIITWEEIVNYFSDISQVLTSTDKKLSGIDNFLSYIIEPGEIIFSYQIYLVNDLSNVYDSISKTPIKDISRFMDNISHKSIKTKSINKTGSVDSMNWVFDDLYELIEDKGWNWSIKVLKSTFVDRNIALNVKIGNGYEANIKIYEMSYNYIFQVIDYPELIEEGVTNNPIIDFSDFSGSRNVMDAEDSRNLEKDVEMWEHYDNSSDETARILPLPTPRYDKPFPKSGPDWGPETLRSGNIYDKQYSIARYYRFN